jgi:hypothetical protein
MHGNRKKIPFFGESFVKRNKQALLRGSSKFYISSIINKNEVLISLFAPSIHSANWIKFYDMTKLSNKTPIEIVFCGDADYNFKLPQDFTYIYSKVKPSQCSQIAINKSSGGFIVLVSDDIWFSPYSIDHMLDMYYARELNTYDIVSSIYKNCSVLNFYNGMKLWGAGFFSGWGVKGGIIDHPLGPLTFFIKKEAVEKVGGIDKNFITSIWDRDLSFRLYERGGRLFFNPLSNITETSLKGRLSQTIWSRMDRRFLWSLWCKKYDGESIDTSRFYGTLCNYGTLVVSKERLKPLDPFNANDPNFLLKSQGVSGKWE